MAEPRFVVLDSPWDVELSGMRLIEAAAGTGKTWMIAALVLRLLLERHIEIARILVVTYTRAACGELRGRIRTRLGEALAAFETGRAEEPYLRTLLERCQRSDAIARLRLAIESFDEAAIFTIHGFCQRAAGESALAAAQAFERELITDQGELLAAAARDAWRREMATGTPLWAQWLIEHVKGPEGLADTIRSHLGRVDAPLDAPAPVDRESAERNFHTALAAVRRLWQSEGEPIRAWLASARLNRQSYGKERMAPRIAALDAWLSAQPALLPLPEGIELFGLTKITAKLNQGGSPPDHPFFAAMDTLLTAAAALQTACEHATRRLMRDFLPLARAELAEMKRRSGQQSYDDLLIDLVRALEGPVGARLIERLRARYRIALVDEFQDTDPLQLKIFNKVFGTAERPLIFVGDPKQAIYGFRGADVFAYLTAREQVDTGYALLENRRSDPPLLDAVNALFARPRPFLLDGMPYEPARAASMARSTLRIADQAAPLTLWTMPAPASGKGFPKEAARALAAEATAADIARLLRLAAAGKALLDARPLAGGDIAVLVRRHRDGDAVRAALARHGISSASGGGGSVWHSAEAEEIERLLLAVAEPAREGLVRAALATVLLGADATQLAVWLDDEAGWSARLERFHDDRLLLRERGFMAMWRRLLRREGVIARVLARPDGERRLTNYRHLAELLHAAEQGGVLDAEGLARHVARQRKAPEAEESQLRLESDAHLVRIVTLHAAKGLQYPIVYCPFLWDGNAVDEKSWPVLAHDGTTARIDFGSSAIDELRHRADLEAAAEELRLAYVALTRAEHRCVVIWGKVNHCARSPLAWLLFGPHEPIAEDPHSWLDSWLETHDDMDALRAFEAGLGGALRVTPLPQDGMAPAGIAAPPAVPLYPRPFIGKIPSPWWVQSFSLLAASLAKEAESADHDALAYRDAVPPAPTFENVHAFPRGTRAGSCLHALFERIDFQHVAQAGPIVAATLAEFGYAQQWQPVLERLVADVLATPLDASGLRLADVPRGERLSELEFTFPLGSAAQRAGYMKGFIDLVFRHAGRWYIVDWKSNGLEDYGPAALAVVMQEHHYDLQARIYAAALKRALATRDPGLDWESGFGGVFYLFLRGMTPGSSSGIFFTRPDVADIAEFLP